MVKEQVYEPDWRSEERTRYTINVADMLADVAPDDIAPSIQTAPLGFKPRVTGTDVVASYTEHVLRVVAHSSTLEARTGRTVSSALEPEPFCFLETTDETVDYFTRAPLLRRSGREARRARAVFPIAEAHGALRRHLGVVFDICHQAVEYEDIAESLQKLADAGIPIFKLQEAAALHVPEVTQAAVDTLKRYAKTIYLTQTIGRSGTASSTASSTSTTPSPPGRTIRARANGASTSTSRSSSTTSGSSAPRASPSRTRCAFTSSGRCRASSRSRPIPGTCCRTA